MSDDPDSTVSPDIKNRRKSATNMFNQLMLQNIKKKVVQIAESDSESSNSEEGKNDS